MYIFVHLVLGILKLYLDGLSIASSVSVQFMSQSWVTPKSKLNTVQTIQEAEACHAKKQKKYNNYHKTEPQGILVYIQIKSSFECTLYVWGGRDSIRG